MGLKSVMTFVWKHENWVKFLQWLYGVLSFVSSAEKRTNQTQYKTQQWTVARGLSVIFVYEELVVVSGT